MKSLVMEELKAFFRPELLNRIDEMVVFRPLEKTQVCFPLILCAVLVSHILSELGYYYVNILQELPLARQS